VLVIGCGAVGLNVLQGARLAGAGTIIAVDVGAARLARARQFGAQHAIDANGEGVLDQVRALTGGRGADHVFEAAGHEAAFRLSVEAVRPAGQVVWLGKINVNAEVAFRWGSLMGEKRIVRSSYGDALPQRDFRGWSSSTSKAGSCSTSSSRGASRSTRSTTASPILAQGIGTRTVIQFP
jgi:S-(hydroxymethyl)glutathione dehydrogenase/alcohol dehydrogenase